MGIAIKSLGAKRRRRSLKDVVKALTNALAASPSPYPLPEDLQQVIHAYLDKHPSIDEHESQRVQDELLSLQSRYVDKDAEKHGTFIAALRLLRPAIKGVGRLLAWWDVLVRPTMHVLGYQKAVVADARAVLLSVLIYEDDEDRDGELSRTSALFTKRLLTLYLDKTRLEPAQPDAKPLAEDEASQHIAKHFEEVLVSFGMKKPKDFLTAIDGLVVQKKHRSQALSLLCTFVRYQPPHLHQVLQTSLIEHLLKCLMIDTSTLVISLALTSLVMFLPHIPNSLVAYLPRLFIIYSRLLCWDHHIPARPETEKVLQLCDDEKRSLVSPAPRGYTDPAWEKLVFSSDMAETPAPDLTHYFTFLYGLYPLNFTSYIRNPLKFLKTSRFHAADDIELDKTTIRSRTERYRQLHLLHPNFFQMTIDAELTDLNRWIDCDPADVVAGCVALCAAAPVTLADPGPPPTAKLPDIPPPRLSTEDIPQQSLLSMNDDDDTDNDGVSTLINGTNSVAESRSENWRNTLSTAVTSRLSYGSNMDPLALLHKSTSDGSIGLLSNKSGHGQSSAASQPPSPSMRLREAALDSPTLPPVIPSGVDIKLQEMLPTQETLRRSPRALISDELPSQSGQNPVNPDTFIAKNVSPNSPSTPPASDLQNNVAFLQREVMLLKNDLNFERYLKQQHLSHIGQLQRKHVKDTTIEAETQSLLNSNRALKFKLDEAKKVCAMLRRDVTPGKTHGQRWEDDLNAKVRALSTDHKQWKSDEESIRQELHHARQECERLKRVVTESEARELLSKQKLQSIEHGLVELESLRRDVDHLNARIRHYENREDEFERARHNEELAMIQVENIMIKLRSSDGERERSKRAYNQRVAELEARLQSTLPPKSGHAPAQSFQSMLDSALAASHTRYNQLRKTHQHLLGRYTDLEARYLDLKRQIEQDSSLPLLSRQSFGTSIMYSEEASPPLPRFANGSGAGNTNGDAGIDVQRHSNPSDDFSTLPHSFPPVPTGSSSYPLPLRPHRLESLLHQQANTLPSTGISSDEFPTVHRNDGPLMTPFERSAMAPQTELQPMFTPLRSQQTYSTPFEAAVSSTASINSQETVAARDANGLLKIKPTSEVRVYGRGGPQNIGKKEKEKEKEKEKKDKKEKREKQKPGAGLRSLPIFS
ncbi:MAG: hypothetical protein M1829_004674 [Trizodia sp. TS-e1964]|nr:MAG: hypothetical protein M1829_004674 [Trizodia sp. TS-e1964]